MPPYYALVTGNDDKWREAQRILVTTNAAITLERAAIDLPEIQAATTDEVARHKARSAYAVLGRPVIVEDAGIELSALGGFPGPFIKFWEKLGGLSSICRALDGTPDRHVTAVCVLAICEGDGDEQTWVAVGRTDGTIASEPRGTYGFGWDAIFIPEGETRTFAEMMSDDKDQVSHRRRAWTAFGAGLRARSERPIT